MADASNRSPAPKSVIWPPAQGASAKLKVSLPPFPVTTSPPRPRLKMSLPDVPVQWSPLLSEVKVWPEPEVEAAVEIEAVGDVEAEPVEAPAGGSTSPPLCQERLAAPMWSSVVTSQVPDAPGRPSRSTHTWVPP